MKRMSDRQFRSELKSVQIKNEYIRKNNELKKEREKYKRHIKFPSTSKIALFCIIIICLEIIFFVEFATIRLNDINALYALVAVPVTLTPTIWAYYSKSKAENTEGGIVYEASLREYDNKDYDSSKNNADDTIVG